MPRPREIEKFQRFIEKYDIWCTDKSSLVSEGITTFKLLCQSIPVSEPMGYKWKVRLEKMRATPDDNEFSEYMGYLKKVVFGAKGSANDRKLYAQIKGWLVEKREDKVSFEISTEERLRIAQGVLSGLTENYQRGNGVCPVCRRPKVLLSEVCMDTEPEQQAEDTVAAVAVPV
jgi:hypothetical protein